MTLSYKAVAAVAALFVQSLTGIAVMELGATAALAKTLQVPSTRITLDVPDGFAPSKQFPGFINENTGASIVTVEMPAAAFADFKKADFASKLASNGFANVKPGQLQLAVEHIYATAEQATAAGAFSKFLLIFADEKTTAMLTVNVPKSDVASGKTKTATIEAMLATARLAAAPSAALPQPFTLGYLGPFKAAGVMGNAVLYTLDGKMAPDKPDPGRAVFALAPSIDKTEIKDVGLTSKAALASMFDVDAGKISHQGTITVDGLQGYEIEIEAPRKPSGPPASAYQIILKTAGGGYVRMIGTADTGEGRALVAEFRKMAASMKAAPSK
ncbi:MAG: hypothetical protein ABL893_09700 [Hyphomicrobium sp.]|nr:hypothetical protein [Hyphomicrobium sp.]